MNDSDNETIARKQNRIIRQLDELNFALEPFYRIDFERLHDTQSKIRELRNEITHYIPSMGLERFDDIATSKDKVNLIGILPMMLLSEDLFPRHKDLIDFSANILGVHVRHLNRPSRTRIIGEIIAQIAKLPSLEIELISKKIQSFIRDSKIRKTNFFLGWDSAIRQMRPGNDDTKT